MVSTVLPPRLANARPPAAVEYDCHHIAYELHGRGRGYWLGGCTARTPELAMEWMVRRVSETAVQLDGPAQKLAKAWLADVLAQRVGLLRLEAGQRVTFMLTDDQARYEVLVQPLYAEPAGPEPYSRPIPQTNRRRHATLRQRPTASGFRRLLIALTAPVWTSRAGEAR